MTEKEELQRHVRAEAVRMAKNSGGLINVSCTALCERVGISPGMFGRTMGMTYSQFIEEVRGDTDVPIYPIGPAERRQRASHPLVRRDQILGVALVMASKNHYLRITRDDIARTAGVAAGSVTRYFGDMATLRAAVLRAAVASGAADIVAQGILERDPVALRAPEQVLAGARAHLAQLCEKK